MAEDRTQELLLLGKISGNVETLVAGQEATNARLDGLDKRVNARLDGLDERLRDVEKKAAVSGALSGGAMSIGVALIIEGLKQWIAGPKGP